jgi:hypothetical protein
MRAAVADAFAHGPGDIGEIHRLRVVGSTVLDLVALAAEKLDDRPFEREARVVAAHGYRK